MKWWWEQQQHPKRNFPDQGTVSTSVQRHGGYLVLEEK